MLSSNVTTTEHGRLTWDERLNDAIARFASIRTELLQKRVVFLVDGPTEALESLALALNAGLDFGILEHYRFSPETARQMEALGIARVLVSASSIEGLEHAQARQAGRIVVMTSGTTGALKAIEHRWETLNTLMRVKNDRPRFWFVPYQVGSYAWYQMMCLGLMGSGQDLYCASLSDPVGSFANAVAAGVTAVSSTPTFWRYALLSLDDSTLRSSHLETITLGGEIVDQQILDELSSRFPRASIRHIYASSEAGAAIVVADGKAGFPAERLTNSDSAVGLKVENGKLYVCSAYTTAAATGKLEEWVDTGDLVEVRGDRVYFLGREGFAMINVGGMKAFPAEIEAELIKHPNVVWAQVYPRSAPLVGTLPAARVVLRDYGGEPASYERELSAYLRRSLPEHAIPRSWDFRLDIPLNPNLKAGPLQDPSEGDQGTGQG